MKAIFTTALLVLGLSVGTVEAGHLSKAQAYANAIDKESHHLDEDMHDLFPHHVLMQKKVHQFIELAHSTKGMLQHGHNLQQAEYNVQLMQQTLNSVDSKLHFMIKHQPNFKKHKTAHVLKVVHTLDSYLNALGEELHDLNHVVILPPPYYGYGHYNHYGNDHIVIRPAGIHIHKGGLNLNLPF